MNVNIASVCSFLWAVRPNVHAQGCIQPSNTLQQSTLLGEYKYQKGTDLLKVFSITKPCLPNVMEFTVNGKKDNVGKEMFFDGLH